MDSEHRDCSYIFRVNLVVLVVSVYFLIMMDYAPMLDPNPANKPKLEKRSKKCRFLLAVLLTVLRLQLSGCHNTMTRGVYGYEHAFWFRL